MSIVFAASVPVNDGDGRSTSLGDATVPFSTGTMPPRVAVPAFACDCHMHVYDSTVPTVSGAALSHADASVADYRKLQQRVGLTRTVVVTPSTYGFDNRATVAALNELGEESRGIAVLHPDVLDDELDWLDQMGSVGVRFNLSIGAVTTIDMIAPLAQRIGRLKWHVQIALRDATLSEHADLFASLPVPVVFDHFAGVPATSAARAPELQTLLTLLSRGNVWVKLSGAYLRSRIGAPGYQDLDTMARMLIAAAPDRMLWGSDWPHPTQSEKPDDARLLDLVSKWAPDAATQKAILVDNPTRLYGF